MVTTDEKIKKITLEWDDGYEHHAVTKNTLASRDYWTWLCLGFKICVPLIDKVTWFRMKI